MNPDRATLSRRLCIACAMTSLFAGAVQAQDAYPSKPIRIVMGFPAGGPLDQHARLLSDKLQAELRLQFGDAAAHGWLRQADLVARAAEVARGGYREEHLELAQSHIHALKS